MITLDTTVQHRPNLAFVEIDGETVVYDPEAEMLHHLDATATAVWTNLDGMTPLRVVADQLAEAFAADPETVRRDVLTLAGQLVEDELIVAVGGPGDV